MRFDSLARNSCAPSTRLSPRAIPAARANSGSSSINRGTSSAPIVVAVSSAERTSRSPAGSPAKVRRLKTAIRAPIRSRTSSSPMRVGFRLTSWMRSTDPASNVAATMSGAADEKSPGTSIDSGDRRSTGQTLA
jgi:hypothetical protein